MRQTTLSHQFVEFIPERLNEGVLYISERYGTAAHKCCCGCGAEVITPLTPTDWSLRIDGNAVTLQPSIGNWNFACRSHYLIRRSEVIWAGSMSKQQIECGRKIDYVTKKAYFEASNRKQGVQSKATRNEVSSQADSLEMNDGLWMFIKRWWN